MNEIIDKINNTDSIIEADPIDSELRILDWILYQVCSNRKKVLNYAFILEIDNQLSDFLRKMRIVRPRV